MCAYLRMCAYMRMLPAGRDLYGEWMEEVRFHMSVSWICLGIGIVVLAVGIITFIGKFHILFREWKRMPEKEKQKIHIKALCHNFGAVIMVCGVIILVAALWQFFLENMFAWFMIAWFVLAAIDLVWISKSGRYTDK